MERLVLNVIKEIDLLKLDIARVRVDMMNKENPYAVLADLFNVRVRVECLKRTLEGVKLPNKLGVDIVDNIKKISEQILVLEKGEIGC